MFLRYEYINCRGVLLKIIKVQFTYVLVHKARFLTGCTASIIILLAHIGVVKCRAMFALAFKTFDKPPKRW